jgi:ABC-type protease/lipase transport system fused ATPase/permease subunit
MACDLLMIIEDGQIRKLGTREEVLKATTRSVRRFDIDRKVDIPPPAAAAE